VEFDQVAHQRQPEPEPAVPPGTGAIALAKAVEDIGEELWLDPLSRIADDKLHVRVDPLQLDLDPAALRRELHRVAQEVPHDLLQPVGVAADRPRGRGQHRLEPNVLRLGGGTDSIQCVLDDAPEVNRLDSQAKLSAGHP